MTRRVIIVSIAFLSAGLMFTSTVSAQQPDRRDEVVRALLRYSRPLTGAHVEIPAGVYHRYLRELHAPERPESDAPVPYIAESGTYHLTVGADQSADLKVKICLRVFDPRKCLNIPILGTKNVIWEDLAADDKGAILTTTSGWVRFTAPRSGLYTITGRLRKAGAAWRNVIPTVRTAAVFDSPGVWEVRAEGQVAGRIVGTAERGTHGLLALKPTNKIRIKYTRPMPKRARPPRYSLQGDIAWNLGAAAQQITTSLKATIAAGASDRIVLLLPDGADRVKITGPEVRKVQVGSGRAVVHLRGRILGKTILKVSFERPTGAGFRLGRFGVEGGRWSGGTLVVTNSTGGSEILPVSMAGLRRMSLSEVPSSASAILPAPAVLAYEITSRDFSAEVEVLRLGRFALRQSIVDLAHYEVFLARDGSVICRARYEIRNSNKQFLRLKLPAGAQVLLARVNEKSRPLSQRTTGVPPVKKGNTGETPVVHSEWLLPLERSRASVMGLVSFPAEVVYLCRTVPMGKAGVAEIPLPGIDLPIAYAWCETYVPTDLVVEKWSGVMKKVSRFTSETAKASLDYGWGELAEGYTGMDHPTTPPAPKPAPPTASPSPKKKGWNWFEPTARPEPTPQSTTRPTTQPGYVTSGEVEREMGVPILSRIPILGRITANRAKVRDESTSGFIQLPNVVVTTRSATPILARNYYRTGKDYYDKNEFAEAARYLEQVAKLAPGSAEARNARRLLANPQMPKARKVETKAEQVAARVVKREVEHSNIFLAQQQKAYIQSGKAAAREGRYKEATAKLKAAQAATEQLIARGAERKETIARMRQAQPEMKQLRKKSVARTAELRKEVTKLKKSGEYDKALKVARKLQQSLAGDISEDGYSSDDTDRAAMSSRQSTSVLRFQLESKKLQKEMDELVAAASRKRQEQAKGKRGRFAGVQDATTRPQRRPTGSGGGGGAGAITRLERIRNIRKQETEVRYTKAMQRAREAMKAPRSAEDCARASEEVNYAQTLLATNKSLLTDTEYRAKRTETEKLLEHAERVKVKWQKQQVARQRTEIVDCSRIRESEMAQQKREKIARLKALARTLRDEQKYKQAIEVCGQIRKLDPNDVWAKEWYFELSRFVQILDARETHRTSMQEEVKQLNDVRYSQVPWHTLTNYPDDWQDITLRRKPMGAGDVTASKADRAVHRRLMQTLPKLDFGGIDFKDVVQFLREVSKVNIHVKWAALEAVGVSRTSKVNIHLTNVTLGKAILTILEDVGGPNPLGFVVDEGVITISSKDDLSSRTIRRKPKPTGVGDVTASKADRAVHRRLMQTLPRLDFSGIDFKDVVQFLREVSDISIHVKWNALEAVGVDRTTKVNIHLTNVTLRKAILTILEDVGGVNPLGFVVDEGVITITTRDDLSSRTVTRVYDIRDLVVRVPNFKGPNINLRTGSGNNNNNGDSAWDDDDDDGETSPRQEMTNDILDLLRSTIAPNSWRENSGEIGSIRELGGQIIVTNTAENQRALMDLLVQLRQVRGPQVEYGKKIAQQRAANLAGPDVPGSFLDDVQVDFITEATKAHRATRSGEAPRITLYSGQKAYVVDRDGGWRHSKPIRQKGWDRDTFFNLGEQTVRIKDKELDSFIRRNYDWAIKGDPLTGARIPNDGTLLLGGQKVNVSGLVSKLRFNRGQKVVVKSLNVNADARAATALGVRFKRGGKNVNWAVINEAQFRTLMELDAELTRRSGRAVAANDRLQETIVGTDARLSNEMIANITFAGDMGNTLNISGNTINLAHEGYLLLSDGGHLTVVRAGAMQHWQEKPADVQFVEVPQNIEVPRVGQLFRFERTLLEPSDQMVLRVEYKQKGASK